MKNGSSVITCHLNETTASVAANYKRDVVQGMEKYPALIRADKREARDRLRLELKPDCAQVMLDASLFKLVHRRYLFLAPSHDTSLYHTRV